MKVVNNIGLIVLAIWIVAKGIIELFRVNIPSASLFLPLLAILAGVLILLRIRESNVAVNLGLLLLSLWLILTGLIPLLNVTFPEMAFAMAVLGLAAGVLILVGQ
jgi:hypothetical protein